MANGRTRRSGKWIALAVVLIGIVIVGLAARKKPPIVQVMKVSRENLTASITSNGKVEPIDPAIFRSQFPAFVENVSAVEGQAVDRGQLILTLAANDLRSQLAQAGGDLLASQTDLRNAQGGGPPDQVAQIEGELQQAQIRVKSLQRTQQALEALLPKHAATQDEVDQNQTALSAAQAALVTVKQRREDLRNQAALGIQAATLRIQQATEQIKSLEEKIKSATVVSPINGTLYSLPVKAGDYVTVGQTLAEMADLSRVRVRAFIDEPDLGSLASNQAVEVTWDAHPNAVWKGRTEGQPKEVVPLGNRSVGQVLCSVDNSKLELLPNVNVAVRILVSDRPSALVVPRAAVRTEDRNHYVFVLSGDHLDKREISVGIASTGKYEVLSGLSEGDRVAIQGDVLLRNGMLVRAREAEE